MKKRKMRTRSATLLSAIRVYFFKVCLPACTKEIQSGGNGRSHGEEQGA
jgi:hypothetical protein